MRKDFTKPRQIIVGLLALLVVADGALGAYSWWLAKAPRLTQQELDRQNLQLKLWRADIDRAKSIKRDMPASQKDCEGFEKSFLAMKTGDSTVSEELDGIANKTGLQIASLNFRHKEVAGRDLTEVGLDLSINGTYSSVVNFLNGLQRSQNIYVVDGLGLAPAAASPNENAQGSASMLRMLLRMRTYYRTLA